MEPKIKKLDQSLAVMQEMVETLENDFLQVCRGWDDLLKMLKTLQEEDGSKDLTEDTSQSERSTQP